jgi:DNA-directed RNA polymerase specialized sigma24 family protein
MNEGSGAGGLPDHDQLGIFMAECRERLRRGEEPSRGEIGERFPGREDEIQAALRQRGQPLSAGAEGLGDFLNRLPPRVQQLIFLRDFKKLPWKEISRRVAGGERDLRVVYARAIEEILSWEKAGSSGSKT